MSQATEEIKARIDIVDLLSEYLQLKKAGVNYRAVCPFHHEKTPSFMISKERQIWHCFGCGEGGDIFGFIMRMEGMEFLEALKFLAEKAGVKLPKYSNELSGSQRNRLLDVLKLAAKFYHKIFLDSPQAQEARDYLYQKRRVSVDTAEDFQVGYIPDEWSLLTDFLLKKGYGINDLIAAGLTIKKDNGGNYDRFRGRVMFPLNDVHGNVVGFTGRLLKEDKPEAGGKYVNTPQTAVYDKSRVIYGLDKAKAEARRQNKIIIVEGQMDVIACHQAGQINTAASSGTALTVEQIRLLKRFTPNLYLSFDMDAAGQNAASRGIELALEEGMKLKIITLPPEAGKDPDECLKKNPAAWTQAVESAQNIMDYIFAKALANKKLKDPTERSEVAKTLLVAINRLPDRIEQDYWIKKLSSILDIGHSILYEKLSSFRKPSKLRPPAGAPAVSGRRPNEEIASENLLALVFAFPALFPPVLEKLNPEALAPEELKNLYNSWLVFYNTRPAEVINSDQVIHSFRSLNNTPEVCQIMDILELLISKEMANFSQEQAHEEIYTLTNSLNSWYNNTIRRRLEREVKEAENAGNKNKILELFKKFKELI